MIANEALAFAGSAFILSETGAADAAGLGPAARAAGAGAEPVDQGRGVRSEAQPDPRQADLSLQVLTYRDLDVTNPGYWVYLAAFTQKEAMSALNTLGDDERHSADLGRL